MWLRGGPVMFRRRTALYCYPLFSTALALLLLCIAAMQDVEPGPRSRLEIMLAIGGAMMVFAFVQVVNWRMLMRWFARGEPSV